MLGILLLFFIGKYFYELAQDYEKQRWLFGILGIVSYYVGTIIAAFVLLIFDETIFDSNSFISTLMVIPFGIAFAYLFYYLLKQNWEKHAEAKKEEIDDIGAECSDGRKHLHAESTDHGKFTDSHVAGAGVSNSPKNQPGHQDDTEGELQYARADEEQTEPLDPCGLVVKRCCKISPFVIGSSKASDDVPVIDTVYQLSTYFRDRVLQALAPMDAELADDQSWGDKDNCPKAKDYTVIRRQCADEDAGG